MKRLSRTDLTTTGPIASPADSAGVKATKLARSKVQVAAEAPAGAALFSGPHLMGAEDSGAIGRASKAGRILGPDYDRLGVPQRLYIDGKWQNATGGTQEIIDPATEEVITRSPLASAADVGRAVAAAKASFESEI